MVNRETVLKLLAKWAKKQQNKTKQNKKTNQKPIVTKVRKVVISVNWGGGYFLEKARGNFPGCWKSSTSSSRWWSRGVYVCKESLSSSWNFTLCVLPYTIISQWMVVLSKTQVEGDPSSFHFVPCLTHFVLEAVRVLSLCIHYTSLSPSTCVFIPRGYIYICSQIYIFKSGEERKVLHMRVYI